MDIKRETISVGSIAFLAGIVATLVTAIAVVTRKAKSPKPPADDNETWEDPLGI